MNRRRFLGRVGAVTAAWVAGCVDGGSSGDSGDGAESEEDEHDEENYADDQAPDPVDPTGFRRLRWIDETPRSPADDIFLGVDSLYLCDEDRLRCLGSDGELRWQAPIESSGARVGSLLTLLVHDGETLTALNEDDGSIEWSVDFEAGTRPVMDPLYRSPYGAVSATEREVLLCEDGDVQWRRSLPEDTHDVTAIRDSTDRFVYVTADGRFRPIEFGSGELGSAVEIPSDAGGPWTITSGASEVVVADGAGTIYTGDFDGVEPTLHPPEDRSLAGRPRVLGQFNGWLALHPTLPADFDGDGDIGHALRIDVTDRLGAQASNWSTTVAPWRDAASTWTGQVESSSDVLGVPSAHDGGVYLPLGDRVVLLSGRDGSVLGTFDPFGHRSQTTDSPPPKIKEVVHHDHRDLYVDTSAGVFGLEHEEERCTDVMIRDATATESRSGTEIEASLETGVCRTIVSVEVVGDDVILAEPFEIRPDAEPDPSAGVLPAGGTTAVVFRTDRVGADASGLSVRVRGTWGDTLDEQAVTLSEERSSIQR